MDLFICILILFGSTVNSVSAIDCKTRPCHFHASCTDSPDPVSTGSSYTCTCNTGYEGDGKHNCIDVHICNKPDTCGPNAICLYKPGKYYCNCKEGYSHDQITNFGCIDVNECVDPNICGVNAVCKNINGSFTCGCLAGYVKDQSGICQDFDECTDLKLCPNNYQCKNTAGSYKCECQEGYELRNGCIDRDECLNKNICGLDAVCINTNGSYECKCPAGYEGDPQIRCTDIDECLKGNDCKRYNAACLNEPGTYSCVCPTGTTGNPTEQCMAIVETTTTEPREVEAIMQLREERQLKEGSAPSLNLWLSAENGVLHFSKNHNVYKDKSFKITIHVEDNIKARYKFQRLICYNKTQATQIYCNDDLKIDINGDYYTEVQKALPTLEAEWKCKLKAKSHTTPEVSLSFLVGFVTSYSKPTVKPFDSSSSNQLTAAPSTYTNLIVYTPCITVHNNKGNITVEEYYKLIDNKSFRVEIISDTLVSALTCRNKDKDQVYIRDGILQNQGNNKYSLNVTSASNTMATYWKCNLYYNLDCDSNESIPQFEVVVDQDYKNNGPGKVIELLVNNNKIQTTVSDDDETRFDEKGEYTFLEGELAKITCSKVIGVVMNVSFDTFNPNGSGLEHISTEKVNATEQTIYIKLTNKHHNSYLTCDLQTKSSIHSKYSVRLDFKQFMSFQKNDTILIHVNGLLLAPRDKKYLYEYIDGENITITKSKYITWLCSSDRNEIDLYDFGKSFTLNEDACITCNSTKGNFFSLKLVHLATPFENCPLISGLSPNKIIAKYRENSNTYTIKYKNPVDSIKLVCEYDYTGCEIYKNAILKLSKHDFGYVNETNKFRATYSYSPMKEKSISRIVCVCPRNSGKKFSTVVEIFNHDLGHGLTGLATSPGGGDTLGDVTTSSSKVDEEYDRDPGLLETGVLVAIGAAILVIIIAVIWIIVSVYKRKRRHEQTQDSDIHYENLGTGSLPTPVPWDTYSSPGDAVEPTYSEPVGLPSSNNLYAEPGANSQRQIPNEYAEINAASELDYTALEAQGPLYYSYASPQAMYSEVKPKSARGIAPQAALKPQVTYAKVAPKSQRKKSKEDTYANASAFETQQYVNVKAEQESTEPAYCEVSPGGREGS